jgi:hypothetical protein
MPMPELSGSQRAIFSTSRWAVVLASDRSQNPEGPEGLAQLCRTYWKPVLHFLRARGYSTPESQLLLQDFFAYLLGPRSASPADRPQGRFRTYLLARAQRFLFSLEPKPGGVTRDTQRVLLLFEPPTPEEMDRESTALTESDPVVAFDTAWARTVFDLALDRLQNQAEMRGRRNMLEELGMYLTGEFPEADKARLSAMSIRLGMSVPMVKISISRLRQRFRAYVREEVAGTLARPSELDDELQCLSLSRRLQEKSGDVVDVASLDSAR